MNQREQVNFGRWVFKCVIALVMILAYSLSFPSVYAATMLEPGLLGKVIVLDAGHGGPDGGATGYEGLKEKQITLPVAQMVAKLLRQVGARVYLTRTTDDDLATDQDMAMRRRHKTDLRLRKEYVLDKKPDAFVSVHCNAVVSPSWSGAQAIYMKGNAEGEELAKIMQRYFKENLLATNRGADDMSSLYLLKRLPGPTVLAEIGFITNPNEGQQLATKAYQERIAFSIYLSLQAYFGKHTT